MVAQIKDNVLTHKSCLIFSIDNLKSLNLTLKVPRSIDRVVVHTGTYFYYTHCSNITVWIFSFILRPLLWLDINILLIMIYNSVHTLTLVHMKFVLFI